MIPRINHSRSQLQSFLNQLEDGCYTFYVPTDVYSDLFDALHPEISRLARNGWRTSKNGKMRYLWFAELSETDVAVIEEWRDRFKKYVLLGKNDHLKEHFTDELDFCLALDFNKEDPSSERRTLFGEAEYQAKYHQSSQHLSVLGHALMDAIKDLPIPAAHQASYCLTCIPAPPGVATIPRRLAAGMAKPERLNRDFVDAQLTCPKPKLKNSTVADKIPMWRDLFERNCVTLTNSVAGRLVVIVDDLYQSGATMWTYAEFLKSQGATHVIGLPCVKSLRDSDNSP